MSFLPWIGAVLGTAYAGFARYFWIRKHEGAAALRRRSPLLGFLTVITGAALASVAQFTPGEWWNYTLIPGSTFEWYSAAAWLMPHCLPTAFAPMAMASSTTGGMSSLLRKQFTRSIFSWRAASVSVA